MDSAKNDLHPQLHESKEVKNVDKDYATKRTIDEILDIETGQIIKAEEYFKFPESRIIADRRRLQEAIAGFSSPKYVCAYCQQLVKLSGRVTRRGQVNFFAHLYDSDDCEVKTNGNLSKEEIEFRKYGNIRESERHIYLKNQIAKILKTTPDITNVEIEKRITSDLPYLYWRRPDVYAEYQGKNIVFELQLSTTFLSVVVDRDIFYRMNNTFIVWIFNFSDNQEYVNLNNLMCKDIYYANKRNAFIFDKEAQLLSEKTGELHLLCKWFEPIIENNTYKQGNDAKKEEYIKFSDLKFDDAAYKPYYIDADVKFSLYQRKYFDFHTQKYDNSLPDIERLNEIRLKKLQKKQKNREFLQQKKEERLKKIKEEINQGLTKLQPFQKKNKWGYEVDGIIILEPTFEEVSEISGEGYAMVKKRDKYGLVDKFGGIVLNCEHKELIPIFTDKYLANRKKELIYIDIQSKKEIIIQKLIDKNYQIKLTNLKENARIIEFENTIGILKDSGQLYSYDEIEEFVDGKAIARKDWKFGYINDNGDIIIPFEYDDIEVFIDGKAKARKNFHWDRKYGYISEEGEVIIPFEYNEIGVFIDGIAKAKKNSRYGYIDEKGEVIIPFEYERIEIMENKFILIKSDMFQLIEQDGLKEQIVECSINGITDFGVFVESTNIKGLLHKSEIKRAGKNISDFMRGDILKLYILSADVGKQRLSFSILENAKKRIDIDSYIKDSTHTGEITKIVKFGLFIELEDGIGALLHISELRKHNKSCSDFKVGEEIKVMILEINKIKNRITLSIA